MKERLTGAVLLVAVMVLLVPEILSGPKRTSPAVSIAASGASDSAPAPASGDADAMRSYTIKLDPPRPTDAAPAPVEPTVEPMAEAPPVTPGTSETAAARVVEPAQLAADPAARASSAPRAGAFAVQVGSFGNRNNAERLVSELNSKGFPAYIGPATGGARPLVRVRVGPVQDRAEAAQLLDQLKRAGQSGSIVADP